MYPLFAQHNIDPPNNKLTFYLILLEFFSVIRPQILNSKYHQKAIIYIMFSLYKFSQGFGIYNGIMIQIFWMDSALFDCRVISIWLGCSVTLMVK